VAAEVTLVPTSQVVAEPTPSPQPVVGKATVIFFTAENWPFCRQLKPVVDGLKGEYSDRVEFQEVDFYANRDHARELGAPGHPTLVVLRPDGSTARVLPGVPTREEIVAVIDEALK
jgi:thiol-disulfide isomerase/thioredoxin